MSETNKTLTAVIRTGGKQYLVQEGNKVKVDRLKEPEGAKVTFSDVLLIATEKTTKVGNPVVKNTKVEAEVIAHARYPKVIGVKMKAKKRNHKYFGHKQHYTEVEIKKITTPAK